MAEKIQIRFVEVANKNNNIQVPVKKNGFKPIFLAVAVGLIAAGLFCSGVYVLATTYGVDAPFPANNTLNPSCTPGATYCTVASPLTNNFSSDFTGTGNLTTTKNIYINAYNSKEYFGALNDASIYYDGSNLNINPKEHGFGGLIVNGAVTANSLTIGTAYTLPTTNGTGILSNDGSGNLTWASGNASYLFAANNFSGTGNFTTTGTGTFNYFKLGSSTTSGYVLTANASGVGTWQVANSTFNSLNVGEGNTLSNSDSAVLGYYSTSSGNESFVLGDRSTASGNISFAFGSNVTDSNDSSFAFGANFTNSTASSFQVGFGQADFKVASGAISFPNNATLNTGSGNITSTGAISGGTLVATAAGGLTLGTKTTANIPGYVKLISAGANSAFYTTFTAGTQTANATYTLPLAPPTSSGYVLSSTTTGTMSWVAAGGGWVATATSDLSMANDNINNVGGVNFGTNNINITNGGGSLNSISIGTGNSFDNSVNSISIGNSVGGYGTDAVTIGGNASTKEYQTGDVVIGYQATDDQNGGSVVIGYQANGDDNGGQNSTLIGYGTQSDGNNDTVMIGYNGGHNHNGARAIAVGSTAYAAGDGAIVIGYGALANHNYSTAIGYGVSTPADNELVLGGYNSSASASEDWLTIVPTSDANSPTVSIGVTGTGHHSILNVYGTVHDYTTTTSLTDVAEDYPTKDSTLSPGEIVSLDITNPVFVVRSNSSNSSNILGVVSTAPGMELGVGSQYSNNTTVPVALSGRVPVKVDGEGGAINIGDRIALSSTTSGVGMKASTGNNTIGIALESFSGTDASTTGTITVFVQNQQYSLSSSGTIGNGQVAGVNGETFLQSVNDSLASLGIAIKNGVVNIATLTTQNFTTDTATIKYLQMTASNGDIYCTWLDANGDWQKTKGNCATVATANTTTQNQTAQSNVVISQDEASQLANQASQVVQQATQAVGALQNSAQQAQNAAQSAAQSAKTAQNAAASARQAAQQVQAQQQVQVLNISSVSSVSDVNVIYGTALGSVPFPINVNVILSDNSTQNLGIVWDGGTPAYDPNTAGTYVFSGALTLPDNVTNTNNLKASMNVIVAPQSPVASANTAGNLIQNGTAGLLNGIGDFVNWIFVKPIENLFSK